MLEKHIFCGAGDATLNGGCVVRDVRRAVAAWHGLIYIEAVYIEHPENKTLKMNSLNMLHT